jgi:PEP-CTERM motif
MGAQALDGERAGDADAIGVDIGLVVEIFDLGLGRDRGVDLLLSRNACVPPFQVGFHRRLRPIVVSPGRQCFQSVVALQIGVEREQRLNAAVRSSFFVASDPKEFSRRVEVNGGAGTVINKGPLQIATLAPLTITGSFTQTAAGALGLDFAGDVWGRYGALTVTKLTTLDGGLAIDLTNGFTLATHDSFDILGFGGHTGNFDALTLDGAACSSTGVDKWACGGGVRLKEVIDPTSLGLFVARGSAVFGPVGSSPIPEPATWAMLALGFLGLGGLGLRKRKRADEIGFR